MNNDNSQVLNLQNQNPTNYDASLKGSSGSHASWTKCNGSNASWFFC